MKLISRSPNPQNDILGGKKILLIAFLVGSCKAFLPVPVRTEGKRSQRLHALNPEENPYGNPDAKSVSGVRFASVLTGMHTLFPPQDLERRNALSRTDGYWPFIQKGQDPPKQFTYGEFDFYFFAQLLDRAHELYFDSDNSDSDNTDWQDKVFCDIGSGTGRLVLAAAGLHPSWRKCRGIELLPGLHKAAEDNLETCQKGSDDDQETGGYTLVSSNEETGDEESLPLAPIQFTCGSFDDPYVYFGDADCVFVFSSCMSEDLMGSLSNSIGRQCKPGTIVITTEYMLDLEGQIDPVEEDPRVPSGSYELQLVEKLDGWCWLTGGASTAFIHRVTKSLWKDGSGELKAPERSLEDVAFQVVTDLEAEKSTDTDSFKRGVYNNMVFHDVPESWRPDLQGQ